MGNRLITHLNPPAASARVMSLKYVVNIFSFLPSGGGEDVGLHAASDRRRNPNEKEKEEHCHPEEPGQSSPHTAEEPIECLSAGQDFQLRQNRVTTDWLLDQTFSIFHVMSKAC